MANYSGKSYFWEDILDFFDDDTLGRAELYKGGLHRIFDSVTAVRDMYYRVRQDLSSQDVGQPAILRGTVALGSLTYYDPIDNPLGTLDGKTLILSSDIGGPVTVTFGQPQSPAEACSQINIQAAATGIEATVDDGFDPITATFVGANVGRLRLLKAGGGGAFLAIGGAGTANGVLGLPLVNTNVPGSSTAYDGATRVGVAAIGAIPAGTLRSVLTAIAGATAACVLKVGDTMTGNLTFTGSSKVIHSVSATRVSRSQWRIPEAATGEWLMGSGGIPIQNNATGNSIVEHDLDVATGDVITSVSVFLEGATGHVGIPTYPSIRCWKWPDTDATPTQIGSTVTDTPVDNTAYEARHSITISGLSETVGANTLYWVAITGEDGAQAVTGLQVFHVEQTVTATSIPPGG